MYSLAKYLLSTYQVGTQHSKQWEYNYKKTGTCWQLQIYVYICVWGLYFISSVFKLITLMSSSSLMTLNAIHILMTPQLYLYPWLLPEL